MLLIRKRAHARAGLVGNPSDGYHGKTISLIVKNFHVEAVLYEWDDVELVLGPESQHRFDSVHELVRDVKLHGYYGGLRLVKAAVKKFVEYCYRQKLDLHSRNFSVRFDSTIPRQVGLAGSSAIIVAVLRCLTEFYGVEIPTEVQPSLALAAEVEELHIAAGLQDRVIQTYEGLVYMDFSKDRQTNGLIHGEYERLDPKLLPPVYLAYKAEVSEPTEVFHNDIRGRFRAGEPLVVNAMQTFAGLAAKARDALTAGDHTELSRLMDTNFDTRRSIYQLPAGQIEMIEVGRRCGASAKFAGSGGAIIGTYRDEAMFEELKRALDTIGCVVIKPIV
jgi:glucuronokinase